MGLSMGTVLSFWPWGIPWSRAEACFLVEEFFYLGWQQVPINVPRCRRPDREGGTRHPPLIAAQS